MSKQRSKLRILSEYWLVRGALAGLALLPERPAYACVGALGRLYFRCSKSRQRHALRFLGNAYPGRAESELLELGRVATGNVFKVALDMVYATRLIRKGRMRERVDVTEFAPCLQRRPVLIVAAHLGSWEVGAMTAALHAGEGHCIARAFKNPLIQKFLLENRGAAGLRIHPKRGGIRALTRALEDGQVCMTVVDQHQRLRGVRVPFFGELCSTERSAAKLALRFGCPVVAASCVRVGHGFHFKMFASEPLEIGAGWTGDKERDIEHAASLVNQALEAHILRHSDQYLWIHNRYRDEAPARASSAGDLAHERSA